MATSTDQLSLLLRIRADTAGAEQGLTRVGGAAERLRGQASGAAGAADRLAGAGGAGGGGLRGVADAAGGAERSVGLLGRGMAALGTAAGGAVASGLALLVATVASSARVLDEANREMLRTEAVLRTTGGAAGFTAAALQQQARSIAAATMQTTEGVLAAQRALMVFRGVVGDVFERASGLAADMAATFGGDMAGAATRLGAALEDPVAGLQALAKEGIVFTAEQQRVIRALADGGDAAGAQRAMLDALASMMGGAATREAGTLAGAMDLLRQRTQELQVAIAETTGVEDVLVAALERGAGNMDAAKNWLNGLGFRQFADDASRFNGLVERRMALQDAYLTQQRAVEAAAARLAALDAAAAGSGREATDATLRRGNAARELAAAQADLLAAAQRLAGATAEVATAQDVQAQSAGLATRRAEEQAAALRGVSAAAADAGRTISGLRFASDKALEGWSRTDARLRREIERFVKDASRDGVQFTITSTWRSPAGASRGSRHHTGSAVDVVASSWEEATAWWKANSHKYAIEMPVPTERPGDQSGTRYGTGPHWHVQLRDEAGAAREAERASRDAARQAAAHARAEADVLRSVESLARRYLPARAAAQDFAGAQALLAAAGDKAGLSLEEQTAILAGMQAEMDRATGATADTVDAWGELWQEAARSLDSTARRMWGDFVATGKVAMDDLGSFVRRWLGDMLYMLATNPLRVAVGASGGLALGASGAAGAAGAAGTAGATGGSGGVFGSLLGGVGRLVGGNSIGAGVAGGLTRLGLGTGGGWWTTAGTNLIGLPNWALGGGALAGGLAGSLLFGGRGQSGIGSSAGGIGGSLLAGALGFGPIGAVVGGLLGGVGGGFLGSLFGGGREAEKAKRQAYAERVRAENAARTAELSQQSAANAQSYYAAREAINAVLAPYGRYSTDVPRGVSNEYGSFTDPDNLARLRTDYFWQLYGAAGSIGGAWAQGKMDAYSGASLDALIEAGPGLLAWFRSVSDAVSYLTQTGMQLGPSAQEAAAHLIELAGSLDALLSAQAQYRELYWTEAERRAFAEAEIRRTLATVGLAVPASMAAFRGLVEAQDLATAEGRRTYVTLLSVASAFAGLHQDAGQAADALAALRASLLAWVEQMRATAPDQALSLSAAQAQYATQLAAARAGDEDALGGLTGYAGRLIEAATRQAGSATDAERIRRRVLAEVAALGGGYAGGGVASGPASGYPALLHGTEAVIPLRGGAVPVRIDYGEMLAELRALRADVRAGQVAMTGQTARLAALWEEFEADGLPVREVTP